MQNTVIRSHVFTDGQEFNLVQGDITQEKVGAIVNAANEQLLHGGGVAAVIAHAGGPQINAESRAWIEMHGPVSHERPAYTGAGNLPCKYVIHAVGPVWGSGSEGAKLAAAVRGALALADELEIQSISLPAISTGIFGFPKERAARIIFETVHDHLAESGTQLLEVRMTLYDAPTVQIFSQIWDEFYPP